MQDPNIFGCNIFMESMLLGLNFTLHTHTPVYKYTKYPLGQGVGWNDLKVGSHDATGILSFICTVTLNRNKYFRNQCIWKKLCTTNCMVWTDICALQSQTVTCSNFKISLQLLQKLKSSSKHCAITGLL